MQVEIAVVTQGLVMDLAIGGKGVLMLAHADLGLRHLGSDGLGWV